MVRKKNSYYCGSDGLDLFDRFEQGLISKEKYKGFIICNIIKYIIRFEDKNGLEDLYKALDYLERLIDLVKKEED